MASSVYEPHIIVDPLIPFWFHRDYRAPSHTAAPNWHTNIEILRGEKGCGKVICDLKTYDFRPGELFVVNSGELHQINAGTGQLHYYCLIVDSKFCAENGIPTDETRFTEIIRSKKMLSLFDGVAKAYKEKGACRAARIRLAVLALLLALREGYTAKPESPLDKREQLALNRVKAAMTYIRRHLDEALSLDDVAHAAGFSKYYLARTFKHYTGQTVFEYLNVVRCMEAKRRMEEGLTVAEAATACGFCNLSYFTRTYKKYMGELPSADRRGKPAEK